MAGRCGLQALRAIHARPVDGEVRLLRAEADGLSPSPGQLPAMTHAHNNKSAQALRHLELVSISYTDRPRDRGAEAERKGGEQDLQEARGRQCGLEDSTKLSLMYNTMGRRIKKRCITRWRLVPRSEIKPEQTAAERQSHSIYERSWIPSNLQPRGQLQPCGTH